MPSRHTQRIRACRRIAYRLNQAADLVRAAVTLLPDGVAPGDLERDAGALSELADVLRDAAEAYEPRRPVPPPGAPARAAS
jgi:hypothetical protein